MGTSLRVCARGHVQSPENVRVKERASGRVSRECRPCDVYRQRQRRAKAAPAPRVLVDVLPDIPGGTISCARCSRLVKAVTRSVCDSCYLRAREDGSLVDFPSGVMSPAMVLAEIRFLQGMCPLLNPEQMADRIGCDRSTVYRVMNRLGLVWSHDWQRFITNA